MSKEPYRYRCEECGSVSLNYRQGTVNSPFKVPYWDCDYCGHKSTNRLDAKEANKAEL